MGDYVSWICVKCGDRSIIPVALSDGIQFFSCVDEDCEWYAELLIMMDDGIFIKQSELIEVTNKLWRKHEQDKIQESED